MFPGLCRSTVFRWRSVQTVAASSHQDFGKVSKRLWELICPSTPLITPSRKDKLNQSIKCLKTCFELVSSHSVRNGRNLSRLLNSHATIAIKLVYRWHPLKFFMDVNVEPL